MKLDPDQRLNFLGKRSESDPPVSAFIESSASLGRVQRFKTLKSDQSGDCRPFGLLCQTVTVTATIVEETDTITSTVPCSSYLSAQLSQLGIFSLLVDDGLMLPPEETAPAASWQHAYGRSPDCTSFARAAYPNSVMGFPSAPAPVLTDCPDKATSNSTAWQNYIPPGVKMVYDDENYLCCGSCVMNVPRVRVLYFPDSEAGPCNVSDAFNGSMMTSALLTHSSNGAKSLGNFPVTAILDNYTLYSTLLIVYDTNHG